MRAPKSNIRYLHSWYKSHSSFLCLRVDSNVSVINLQKLEALPILVKRTKLKSMFFISTEMGGVLVVVETSFLVFYCLSSNRSWHGCPPLGWTSMYWWSVHRNTELHWNRWNKHNWRVYFLFLPKWVEYRWLLRPHFLSSIAFHPTNPDMDVRP